MKLRLMQCEEFMFIMDLRGTSVEAPDEVVERWWRVEGEWKKCQSEMAEAYSKGERIIADSSTVVPTMPLADSIRASNPAPLPDVESVYDREIN